MNFDKIITKICFALRKTALQVASKQKLIYKFVLSLVPFLFEKVKSIECSHLMMSPDEIDLVIRSEQDNIIRTFYKNNIPHYQVAKTVFREVDKYEVERFKGLNKYNKSSNPLLLEKRLLDFIHQDASMSSDSEESGSDSDAEMDGAKEFKDC